MKHPLLFLISILSSVLILQSCKKLNPQEPIPAYIHIDHITLKTDASKQGSSASKITDAWVYIDEQLIGCFELPATFPVLVQGVHLLKVRAGIKVNGIAATRSPYPFYETFTQSLNFQENVRLNINPVVSYATFARFNFMENFDGVGVILAPGPQTTDDTIKQTFIKNQVFEGKGSGIVHLNRNKIRFHNVSNTSYVLPKGGSPVFLEFNYKCNYNFIVGMYAHNGPSTSQAITLGINPTENWNKIYVYLTPTVSSFTNATDYNIFISMYNDAPMDSLGLLIDNIKLVY